VYLGDGLGLGFLDSAMSTARRRRRRRRRGERRGKLVMPRCRVAGML
jgi:hypothetical protein